MRKDPRKFVCAYCGKENETRRGGKINQFCGRDCRGLSTRRRIDNPFRYVDRLGYVRLKYWDDECGKYRHVFEHRLIWERANGAVPAGHVIHHENEDKQDNRLGNLHLMRRSDHISLHASEPDKYPGGAKPSDYTRRWRQRHPEYKAIRAARARARRREISK